MRPSKLLTVENGLRLLTFAAGLVAGGGGMTVYKDAPPAPAAAAAAPQIIRVEPKCPALRIPACPDVYIDGRRVR